jgi:hypothetical protein
MSEIHADVFNVNDKNLAHNLPSRSNLSSRNESKIILFHYAGCKVNGEY